MLLLKPADSTRSLTAFISSQLYLHAPLCESICRVATEPKPCAKDGRVRREEGTVAGKLFPLCCSCNFPLLQRFKYDLKGSLGFFEFDISQKGPRVCQVWFFTEKHKEKHKALCLLCLSICGSGARTVNKLWRPVIGKENVNSSDI